jgi:2-keto-4-pentenoate hydratase/2-oxohepta-3-ene-1,7-dioic acid hydratase in catechol pathway
MKFVRFGPPDLEKPGLIDATGQLRDISSLVTEIDGSMLSDGALEALRAVDISRLPVVDGKTRLGPCVAKVSKIVGVAINYRLHGVETGSQQPSEPVLFLKAPSSLSGANDPITLPPDSKKLDWEVELGIVIGKRAKNISQSTALSHVAGYCTLDDASERAFQLERGGQQHTKGKSYDGFCPLGPWLVTRDEIADPQDLALWAKVNGVSMQKGTTADMLFSVAHLISVISEFMTLLPGDVIASGTPDGVGRGQIPPIYLKEGDVLELGVAGLGQQSHKIIRE